MTLLFMFGQVYKEHKQKNMSNITFITHCTGYWM